ncbi:MULTISPECIES: glycosyltransferase family 2 protein [unclassified Halomonas]|uniref:glycosyltransferase family 2 protein n=1 Tax=unclassified Halomonas TaxID=2609666 RepID=UPI0020768C86|nr:MULTISPECIES: glycosyltransferase family 2 protein [unclassified Halomonas]
MISDTSPLVSIIVPVFNVEFYLYECLDSVRRQTYGRLEIIVVEDCSTDGSLAKLDAHLEDDRVRVIQHDTNSGLSAARNTGIEAAQGEFVLFVDSDDAIAPELVETCLARAIETEADVVMFDFAVFHDGEPLPGSDGRIDMHQARSLTEVEYFKLPHFAWLKFIRAELLDDPRLRFPVGHYYEDWPFHWELGFLTRKIERIPNRFYQYRQRSGSITAAGDRKLLHIFSAHRLILDIVERHSASVGVRQLLATKIYRGIWFVVMTIQHDFLKEALLAARNHLASTRKARQSASPAPRVKVLLAALRLPKPFAYSSIRSLRAALSRLSSYRRNATSSA